MFLVVDPRTRRGGCPHPPSGAKLRGSFWRAALACPDEGVRAYAISGAHWDRRPQARHFFCNLVINVSFGELGGYAERILDGVHVR
jgi:hypothetical protein